MNDEIANYIEEEVNDYKEETYDLLDYVKLIFFVYLIKGKSKQEFHNKIKITFETYDTKVVEKLDKGYEEVKKKVEKVNESDIKQTLIEPKENILLKMFKKIDTESDKEAKRKFIKEVGKYYDQTSKTLQKEWVNKKAYLSKKVDKYIEIEKVIPYFDHHTGEVTRYVDIATYNSMVYNTNLTKSAWNSTFESALRNGNDLVYLPAHQFACPLCQEHQGKIYSLTGAYPGYELLEDVADKYGTIHPNCKHSILQYWGQFETDKYSSQEWVDKYEAKQKKQGLELKRSRLKNDRKIYMQLGNVEEVDKLNQKIRTLNIKIREQKSLM